MRRSLVALMLLSTVATSFGFATHSQSAAAADTVCAPAGHGAGDCLTACAALAVEALEEHGESDLCDYCHCQFSTVGFPSGMPNWAVAAGQPCTRDVLTVVRPDGHAFAPAITGLSPDELATVVAGRPRWQEVQAPLISAQAAGFVEGEVATSGSWLPVHAPVLTITDPAGVHLRASALQGDLATLSAGRSARIVGADPQDPLQLPATLVLAPVVDPTERMVGVIARPQAGSALPPSIRPGLMAVLGFVIAGSAEEEPAIPRAATIRNGLDVVLFHRHRSNPDAVERLSAEGGAVWIASESAAGQTERGSVPLPGAAAAKPHTHDGHDHAGHTHD